MKKYINNFIRIVAFALVICMISVIFVGCGDNAVSNSYRSLSGKILDSQILAKNENYELSWDVDGKATIFKSLNEDKYWSDILYDAFLEGSISANGNSPISITIANTKTLKWDTITSYSQLESSGNILTKKIENGIRVTYFFDNYKIAIPVEYTLKEDCLNVKIDSSTILEDGTDYKLVSITVAPNLCSVKNASENGALFIPSGCGALMYTAENSDGTREYTGEVYGRDAARRNPLNLVDSQDIHLPVFGVYGDNTGIMGIISSGAESCFIEAKAGDKRLGYSTIGTVFYVRGYDEFSYTYHGKYQGITTRINEEKSGQLLSVDYYPLYGEDANYNGFANKYRNYLINNGKLNVNKTQSSSYAITLLGGTNITTNVLGVPKKELVSLTTFSESSKIISELEESIGIKPYIRMYGYGDSGIRYGSILGGKNYQAVYGNKKDITNLVNLCSDTKLFFDYEIINFSKSGNGFSVNFDTAKTAISHKAEHFPVNPLRVNDEDNIYYTISRKNLDKAADKAVNKAQKYGINNLSFSSLGSTAYSDSGYISKFGIENDVSSIIANLTKDEHTIAVADGNLYAACSADVLFDVDIENGNWDSFDLEIPFYQMVFHSYKPMYTDSVNLSENIDIALSRSVAFGMGIGYTLTHNYVDNSDDFGEFQLYGTVYSDNKDLIYKTLVSKGYIQIYNAISSAELVKYNISEGLSSSLYSNGRIVYVNHTNKTINSPLGNLEPYDFCIE